MAENKKSFILYTDQLSIFEALTDDQAGRLIKHIYKYVNDENPVTDEQVINIAFIPIKQQLKRDLKKWENLSAVRSGYGRMGGIKSGEVRKVKSLSNSTNEAKNEANEANEATASKLKQNEHVNVKMLNVNVNEEVSTTSNKHTSKFKHTTSNRLLSELKSSDHPHEKIAYNFWLLFSENLKKLKINSTDLQKSKYSLWVEPVRLMMERDKRTHEEFQEIFIFLRDEIPRENGFSWAANIRSTSKLREKFEVILKDARTKKFQKNCKSSQIMDVHNKILQKIDEGKFV